MRLGISRDDYKGFIGYYTENDIMFQPIRSRQIDQTGVGQTDEDRLSTAVEELAPDLKIGICGRTRRRSKIRLLLPRNRPELRQLQSTSNSYRQTGGGTGCCRSWLILDTSSNRNYVPGPVSIVRGTGCFCAQAALSIPSLSWVRWAESNAFGGFRPALPRVYA